MLTYTRGDIIQLADNYDALIHGCNCFNTMGAGVAKQIAMRWPQAVAADKLTKRGDASKLGNMTVAKVGKLHIINAYTQYYYGGDKDNFDYKALTQVLDSLENNLYFRFMRFVAPRIGAGLAGGDWNRIAPIIENSILNVTIVEYDQKFPNSQ